jgi:hypothetical protein
VSTYARRPDANATRCNPSRSLMTASTIEVE